MDRIQVRYGESFDLSVESDDDTAVVATLFVGKPGQTPKITIPAPFEYEGEDKVAYIVGTPSQSRIPLGKYNYQINVSFSDGRELKYPNDEYCEENGLPEFIVREALDETEVVVS